LLGYFSADEACRKMQRFPACGTIAQKTLRQPVTTPQLDTDDRERLIRLLGMTGSDHDGEVLRWTPSVGQESG
jgi:hypothetical protein